MLKDMKLGLIHRETPFNAPSLESHRMGAMQAPPSLIRRVEPNIILGHNDSVGDCTCVALANSMISQAALNGFDLGISDDKPVQLYSAVTGYPKQDNGAVMTDVLQYQAAHGYDIGQQVPYSAMWGGISDNNWNLMRVAMAQLGTVYCGVSLSISDQEADIWDVDTPAEYGDPTPGSWGGHCITGFAYTGTEDLDLVTFQTWKMEKQATWAWVKQRMLTMFGVAHRQLLPPNGLNAAGLDADRLAADCASFAS